MNIHDAFTAPQILAVPALLAAVWLLWLFIRHLLRPGFRQAPIMTDNEREFFQRLHQAIPDGFIFPQVAMSALVRPARGTSDRAFFRALAAIGAKRIDYAVYDSGLNLICLVELDDRTHDKKKDQARDKMTASIGIPTLRWQSTKSLRPSVARIREQIQSLSKQTGRGQF